MYFTVDKHTNLILRLFLSVMSITKFFLNVICFISLSCSGDCISTNMSKFDNVKEKEELWYNKLPDCPCSNPDKIQTVTNDGWAIDLSNIEKYHPGAKICYRSYPMIKTSVGYSSQQCCYYKNDRLITWGPGAGTPDKVSTLLGEDDNGKMKIRYIGLWGHWVKDVYPWLNLKKQKDGWKFYNTQFPPNQGSNCDDLFKLLNSYRNTLPSRKPD